MSTHQIVSVTANDGYQLQSRYWQVEHPAAILVMVHGVVSHALWLESVAEGLQQHGIACLVADRRGAGLNTVASGDAPGTETLLDDLDLILDSVHTTDCPVHLCGFCWGANYVVNHVLDRRPDISSISLLAPSLFPSERITDQTFEMGDSAEATETPVMPIECFTDGPAYEAFIKPDPLRLRKVSTRMNTIMADFSQGMWLKFLRLSHPVMLVLASDDEVVDNDATKRLYGRLRCEIRALHVLTGKHGIQFDASADIVDLIKDWIRHVDR